MAQPPTTPLLTRELVRGLPFAAQRTFNNAALANGGTLVAAFDVGLVVSDVNQFIGAAINAALNPSADATPFAIGPFLDAGWFSSGAGTITTQFAIDYTCSYRNVAPPVAVAASTWGNISGLRITGRFARVTFTNTSGGPVAVEFGVFVRSV